MVEDDTASLVKVECTDERFPGPWRDGPFPVGFIIFEVFA